MATYYASPTGGGTGLTQGSPFQITSFWAVEAPGDTLILLDGEYTGANSMIDPPDVASNAGTSGNPITIKALNPGQVLINGQFARRPLRLRANNDWFIVEDINCKNSSASVVTVSAGNADSIIRRVCAWDTNSGGNFQVIEVAGTRTLIEDCFFFGRGRKAMGRLGDTDGTFRRCVGMKTENPETSPGTNFIGMTISCGYESIRPITENCIAFEDMQVVNAGQSNQHILATDHWDNWSGSGAVTVKILGCIAYHYDAQETIADRVMRLSTNPASIQPNTTVTTVSRDNLAVRRQTADPATGIQWMTGGDGVTNGISIADTDFWCDSVGTLAGGTHTTEDGVRTLAQLGGSLIQEQATTRPTSGVWIRNRYVNGTLTGTSLWPWPMRQRIIDAMTASPYSAIGLNGSGEKDIHTVIENLTGASISGTTQSLTPAATAGSMSAVAPALSMTLTLTPAPTDLVPAMPAAEANPFNVNPGAVEMPGSLPAPTLGWELALSPAVSIGPMVVPAGALDLFVPLAPDPVLCTVAIQPYTLLGIYDQGRDYELRPVLGIRSLRDIVQIRG